MRARADQRHLAGEHVAQLWQFIERASSKKTADGGNAMIVTGGLTHFAAILEHRHGPEFEHRDDRMIEAPAPLAEQDRTRARELDRGRDQKDQRHGKHQQRRADQHILATLDDRRPVGERLFLDREQPDGTEIAHFVRCAIADQVAREMRNRVDLDRELLEGARDLVEAPVRRLRQCDDDAVDVALASGLYEIGQRSGNRHVDIAQSGPVGTIIERADKAQPVPLLANVGLDSRRDRPRTIDGYAFVEVACHRQPVEPRANTGAPCDQGADVWAQPATSDKGQGCYDRQAAPRMPRTLLETVNHLAQPEIALVRHRKEFRRVCLIRRF